MSVWELDFTVTAGPNLNSVSEQLSFSFAFFRLHRNQCISQMKEVKEQCEERIEEVTRKGNEAMPSHDLNEQKDQSQQVILAGAGVNLESFPLMPYPDNDPIRFLYLGRMKKEKWELAAAILMDAQIIDE